MPTDLPCHHALPLPSVQYWGRLVEEAQAPHPLSSRDGRLIKTIPPERRLAPQELQCQLEGALAEEEDLQEEARDLMCVAWGHGACCYCCFVPALPGCHTAGMHACAMCAWHPCLVTATAQQLPG